jgi:predicted nucleic acid binding AN1-type Zn finger protein
MSYEIIYDKQFVKVDDNGTEKYIPMILCGSNNCYEIDYKGRERRERNWFPFGRNILATVEEMVGYWEEVREEKIRQNKAEKRDEWHTQYSDSAFGYWTSISLAGKHTSKTSFRNITGIFTNGAKKSLTIEQLASEGVRVIVKSSYCSNTRHEELGTSPYSLVVENDSELLGAIAQCNARFKNSGIRATIEFAGMHEEKPKRIRKKYFPTKTRVKVPTIIDESYRIKVGNYGYFVKETRTNLRCNMTGKVFTNRATVLRKLKQLENKNYKCSFEIEVSHAPIEVMV